MERRAECHCGALKVIASGEPERVYLCDCQACRRRTGTAFHFGASYPKAQVRLGWHPRLATDLALDWTAAWDRRQQDGASARDLCLDQIQRYQKQDGR